MHSQKFQIFKQISGFQAFRPSNFQASWEIRAEFQAKISVLQAPEQATRLLGISSYQAYQAH